jgi:serine protease Do
MNWVRFRAVTSAFLVSAVFGSQAAADSEAELIEKASAAFVATAQQVLPGVVTVTARSKPDAGGKTGASPSEDRPVPPDKQSAREIAGTLGLTRQPPRTRRVPPVHQGSGFLVSAAGLIVTASHGVEQADEIVVRLHNGKEYDAKLVGADRMSRVAVLRIAGENFPVLRLGDSSKVEVGQWVMTAGHPFGLGTTVSFGIVGAVGVDTGEATFGGYIQTDAMTQPGYVGGPLVNLRGEVIGMNMMIISRSGAFEGVSLAMPINMVKTVKDQISATGKMVYSYLGISLQEVDQELADALGLSEALGVRVSSVLDGSPAHESRLTEGDVILEVDGNAIETDTAFKRTLAFKPPGTRVTLTILRDGERKSVDVELGTLPTRD